MADRKRRDKGRTGLIDGQEEEGPGEDRTNWWLSAHRKEGPNPFIPGGNSKYKTTIQVIHEKHFFIMRKLDFFILCKSVVLFWVLTLFFRWTGQGRVLEKYFCRRTWAFINQPMPKTSYSPTVPLSAPGVQIRWNFCNIFFRYWNTAFFIFGFLTVYVYFLNKHYQFFTVRRYNPPWT